jgi:hypothetical protein
MVANTGRGRDEDDGKLVTVGPTKMENPQKLNILVPVFLVRGILLSLTNRFNSRKLRKTDLSKNF